MKSELHRTVSTPVADAVAEDVVVGLVTQGHDPVSDAPLYAPQAAGGLLLLLGLLLSPKEPKEPKAPRKV